MSLSEDERQMLHQIEVDLATANPRLAKAFDRTLRRRLPGALRSGAILVAGLTVGLTLVLAGVHVAGVLGVVLAVAGYVVMVWAGDRVVVGLRWERATRPLRRRR